MDYSALNAKLAAKRAKLLRHDDFVKLCQAGSPEHFFALLQQQPPYMEFTQNKAADFGLGFSLLAEQQQLRKFVTNAKARQLLNFAAKAANQNNSPQENLQAWAYVNSLPRGQNRQALTYTLGSQIDLKNILTAYRLKCYYPQADVYHHLTPISYRLSKQSLKQMAESPGLPEFFVALRNCTYKNLLSKDENFAVTGHMPVTSHSLAADYPPEAEFTQEAATIHAKAAKRYPRSMAGVGSYFFAKQREVSLLKSISEAHKYGLAASAFSSYIH